MPQDQKSIQQPKRDRRDYEQIHRRNAVSVIAQKGLPALRRWLPSPRHVFCHGGLPDIDAKLAQFAGSVPAPQSGFHVIANSSSWHDKEVAVRLAYVRTFRKRMLRLRVLPRPKRVAGSPPRERTPAAAVRLTR